MTTGVGEVGEVPGHCVVIRERGLRATMPDGVELVADVWRPAGPGPFPVLLQRLPYGRAVASVPVLPHPSWFARRGYAVAVQDVRGRGESGGRFHPFVHEAVDGEASVEWAAALPFSSGAVGMYGFSYQGINQLLAAGRRPPSLRAVAPMMCGADPYEGWMYHGGCRNWPDLARWAAQLAGQERGAEPRPPDLGALPLVDALGPAPPPWFLEWLDHDVDGDRWAAIRPDSAAVEVPVFTVVGWFDHLAAGTVRLAEAFDAEVVAGPWSHMPWGTRAGDVELGPEASPVPAHEALLAFFDRHLRPAGRDATPQAAPEASPRLRYLPAFGGWRTAPSWPPSSRALRLALVGGGNANSRHGDGRLVPAPAEPGPGEVLVVEPLVPYPGGLEPLEVESAAEDRRDVLCFTGAPLDAALEVTGTPRAAVRTRCDRPTHDVVVTVALVDEDGTSRRLSTGAARVRSEPDGPTDVEVGLRPMSVVCRPGQRLRIDVSGGRFPAHDRNPHVVGVERPARSDHAVATVELLAGEVVLPVVAAQQDPVR